MNLESFARVSLESRLSLALGARASKTLESDDLIVCLGALGKAAPKRRAVATVGRVRKVVSIQCLFACRRLETLGRRADGKKEAPLSSRGEFSQLSRRETNDAARKRGMFCIIQPLRQLSSAAPNWISIWARCPRQAVRVGGHKL